MCHEVCDRSQDAKPSRRGAVPRLWGGQSFHGQRPGCTDVQRDTVVSLGPDQRQFKWGDYKGCVRQTCSKHGSQSSEKAGSRAASVSASTDGHTGPRTPRVCLSPTLFLLSTINLESIRRAS